MEACTPALWPPPGVLSAPPSTAGSPPLILIRGPRSGNAACNSLCLQPPPIMPLWTWCTLAASVGCSTRCRPATAPLSGSMPRRRPYFPPPLCTVTLRCCLAAMTVVFTFWTLRRAAFCGSERWVVRFLPRQIMRRQADELWPQRFMETLTLSTVKERR